MNSYHHLYNRGVNRKRIFYDNNDYKYFLKKLGEYKDKYSVRIICYCLLPNHFHLFIKQLTVENSIGKFIGTLTNSYTKAFNKKYDRTGILFEGRTKNKPIINEDYFLWLCKYILKNPVDAGLTKSPEDWKYSSAQEYFNLDEPDITYTKEILDRFNSKKEFIGFINYDKRQFDYSLLF